MTEYIPTTQEVRDLWGYLVSRYLEFDAWLASVKADAWDEGCNAGHNREHHKNMTEEQARAAWPNPYRQGETE